MPFGIGSALRSARNFRNEQFYSHPLYDGDGKPYSHTGDFVYGQEDPTKYLSALGTLAGAATGIGGLAVGVGNLGLGAARLAMDHKYRPRPLGLKSMLTHAGIMAGAGLAVKGVGMLTDHVKAQRSFSEMLKLYPVLQQESPEKVRLYFDSIARRSPAVATDPIVAGSLIKRLINYDGFDHSVFRDLVQTQSTLDANRRGFQQNATQAMHQGLQLAHMYRTPR